MKISKWGYEDHAYIHCPKAQELWKKSKEEIGLVRQETSIKALYMSNSLQTQIQQHKKHHVGNERGTYYL